MSCSGEGCNSIHIQNKKYNLCGDCVFKKSHKGKSKREVYSERASKKPKKQYIHTAIYSPYKSPMIPNQHFIVDEVSDMNARNQDEAERIAREEEEYEITNLQEYHQALERFELLFNVKPGHKDYNESLILAGKLSEYEREHFPIGKKETFGDPKSEKKEKKKSSPLKRQFVKKISGKQSEINAAYKITCIDMDYTTEPVCTGCLRYQGGDIKLSHSHIISREDCKRIGREDLISDRNNLTYHCMTFMNNKGCHNKHEGIECIDLKDFEVNFTYIYNIDKKLFNRRINKLIEYYEGDMERFNRLRKFISNF